MAQQQLLLKANNQKKKIKNLKVLKFLLLKKTN